MKPPPFEYLRPRSLAEAVDLSAQFDGAHKVLAGGQSLVPLMNMRLARPERLIDINQLPALDGVREDVEHVSVGALTRHTALERSDVVREALPLLAEAVPLIAHPQIRNRGTVGGTVSHADPAAEIPVVLVACGGDVEATSVRGARRIEAAAFFVSVFTPALEADEIVTQVRFMRPQGRHGTAFLEVAKRHGDFAFVSTAVIAWLDGERRVERVQIAVGSVAERPVRVRTAEDAMVGVTPDEDAYAAVASAVRDEINPTGDAHASADYRRHVAGVLVRRGVEAAVARALAA